MNLLDNTQKSLDIVKHFKGNLQEAFAYQEEFSKKTEINVAGIKCPIESVIIREKITGVFSVVINVSIENIKLEVE